MNLFLTITFLFSNFTLPVQSFTLKNGLRVLFYIDTLSPLVSTQVWYKVGSYYEPSGITGISHLLEHMAFKGSKNYPGDLYSKLILENGGQDNAFTSENYTAYWSDLAYDRYELALKLEADRMKNLLLDSQEFESERKVVMEERRLGENSPYSTLYENFYAVAYLSHPYRNPVIGWMDDLKRITISDLRNWYQTYYQPKRAVLVLAGKIKPKEALKKVERYFGGIKGKEVREKTFFEPPPKGERRIKIIRDVKTPFLMLGYRTCGIKEEDYFPLEVLEGILVRGKSSRLYKTLVYEKNLLTDIWGGSDIEKDPGIFYFFAVIKDTGKIKEVENALYQEIEKLKEDTITTSELEKIKNQVLADFFFQQDRIRSLGFSLARWEILLNDYTFFQKYPEKIAAVKKEDIQRVLKRYFIEENRTVALLLPEKK
ncbi:MAG: pitrilysin family protein [candidate division WOR-3 bacterium]